MQNMMENMDADLAENGNYSLSQLGMILNSGHYLTDKVKHIFERRQREGLDAKQQRHGEREIDNFIEL